ncbi:MAG: class I SAM-dependent methyltransferase [Planctomycetaceae bacterium]|nr:class I SAM-dependent methyltransferase [Planctomycetaceae bacterium]
MTSVLTQDTSVKCPVSPSEEAVWSRLPWKARKVLEHFQSLRHGQLIIHLPEGTLTAGTPADDGLKVNITIQDHRFFNKVALGGSLGAADAYVDGDWSCDDLTALLRIVCRNLDDMNRMDSAWNRWGLAFARIAHRLADNTIKGSKKNIAAHYDLSNELFDCFLDETMMYSSAMYESPETSLEAAAIAKLERICQRLNLQAQDDVLEIGTGWGGWARHAAKNYGCLVTTTTISENQFDFAQRRIIDSGLSDRVKLLKQDYRHLSGEYDKVVSIEMIEAVGHDHLVEYFQTCERLLTPGGRLVIQGITMPEQRYERYCQSVDFIQKYIFPGGHLPSVGAMQEAVSRCPNLRLVEAEQFPDSYAYTLRDWRKRFFDHEEEIRRLGFDDRFLRTWDYYFCYCEAAFLERAVSVGQFVWEKTKY